MWQANLRKPQRKTVVCVGFLWLTKWTESIWIILVCICGKPVRDSTFCCSTSEVEVSVLWLFYRDVANVETETHSAADLRLSQINNCNIKVSQVEDCKLTGFTELTGLCALCCFLPSTVQYRPRLCRAVSQAVWMSKASISEWQRVDLVRLGHLWLW